MLYLDSSAIVKLVEPEPETSALVEVARSAPALVSSSLARTEVIRAVRRVGGNVARASEALETIALVPIDEGIIRTAAELEPTNLRTLDAIHLATALSLGADVSALATYDRGLSAAAATAGVEVIAPSPA